MEITLSPSGNFIPRTPVEALDSNTRTSVTGKRTHLPPAAANKTSSESLQISTPMSLSPSSSFMAILPLD